MLSLVVLGRILRLDEKNEYSALTLLQGYVCVPRVHASWKDIAYFSVV